MITVKQVWEDLPTKDTPQNICVLDIETAGLSARYYPVLLLGIAYVEENHWIIETHLCENRSEEPLLLLQWARMLHRFHLFFTFYGKGFDIPFLEERARRNQVPISLPRERHFDLYERGPLKQVEKLQGFERQDTLSGKEWTELYKKFEKEKQPSQKKALLLHNQEDLVGTIHLLLSREELRGSLNWRFLGERYLFETIPSPGNLRLLAVDMENRLWCRDLPLLSFGKYHFLNIGERFDELSAQQKKSLLLLEGRNPKYANIYSLENDKDLAPFSVDNHWRQC